MTLRSGHQYPAELREARNPPPPDRRQKHFSEAVSGAVSSQSTQWAIPSTSDMPRRSVPLTLGATDRMCFGSAGSRPLPASGTDQTVRDDPAVGTHERVRNELELY